MDVKGTARRIYDGHRDLSESARDEDQRERVVEHLIRRADDEQGSPFDSGALSSEDYGELFQALMDLVTEEG